ncbi:MAG: transporter substrate-binding domain-containing protein [Desulfobacterales bacterium]|nr:transporter substrate-binding domain-containing protein [Desulfobacterales bacterium]
MKKRLLLLLLVGALILMFGGYASAAEKIRVGCECTYFPFNYRTADGVLTGYDVDVAKGVLDIIGADFEFVCQKWSGMLPALLANKFDLIVASMSITDKRKKKIDFSIPYRISVGRFVGKDGANLNLFNADDSVNAANFKGVKVGLERATTYANWIEANVPNAKVLLYDTNEALYLDLRNGRTDVIMTNPMKAFLKFLSKDAGKGFGFVSPPLDNPKIFGTGVGIGIAKGREDLLNRINSALKTLIKNGSMEKYSLKYFPFAIHNEKWEGVE